MARSRNIKPGLFKNELLGEADPIITLTFVGLWTLADKEGRLENRPKRIKAELFPYKFDLDLSMSLAWLMDNSFITEYEIGGESYLQINNWRKHQNPHHKEVDSVIPPPPTEEKTNKKQQDTYACAKHELSITQEQAKQVASSPLIPDSLNSDSLLVAPSDKPKRRTKLPDDFTLTDERAAKAGDYWRKHNRLDLVNRGQEIWDGFINHHKQHGKAMADWDCAWVTWYTNALKFENKPAPVRKDQGSFIARHQDTSWADELRGAVSHESN